MRLIGLAVVLAVSLFLAPLAGEAQQAERVYRIGFLSAGGTVPAEREAFRQGLSDHGYVEGRNLLIEWRAAEGTDEGLPGFAAELVRLKVEIIVTNSTSAAVAAKRATTSIPIVFTVVGDPVGVGLVANLARPGGNLTGFTNLSIDITQKRLELFREAVPAIRSIVILTDPGNLASALIVHEARIAASRLGLEVRLVEVRHPSELDPAFKTIVREGARGVALVPVGGPFIATHRIRIIELATKGRIPVLYVGPRMNPSSGRSPWPTDKGVYVAYALLGVPLLREGVAIGVIYLRRTEVQPFTDSQIALLKTFADQAVIAIENVRLFTELQEKNRVITEALERQTATAELLRVISRSQTELQPVFDAIADSAMRLLGAWTVIVCRFDGELLHLATLRGRAGQPDAFTLSNFPTRPTTGLTVGRCILARSVIQISDVETEAEPVAATREMARVRGWRSALAVPMLRDGQPIGAIMATHAEPRAFDASSVEVLKTFADQAVIAIENVRLFKELEVANRELEAASQHKSEFLANMSHELRTPLNAIIGFSEVLGERMFGELNEKQEEYLKDIHASGQHLLSLINDILDLSKIEAGRMELELTDFDLPTALENALTLVRERAGRRSITLQTSVDERLGEVRADERKVRQVVLNLLSNAIKFTPEGGRIEVLAVPRAGSVEVSVSDTGVGIAPEDQEAIFEEFRQVGTAEKKVEGTGLGLALSRKFVELHGGKIWVTSQVGVGSTFTFTIPANHDA